MISKEKAQENYSQSLLIAREIKHERLERYALGSLGLVEWQLGNYEQAIDYYQQSVELAAKLKDPQEKAMALGNLGRNFLAANKLQEAEKALREAIMLWENMREDLPDGDHISMFDKQLLPYHQLQEILVEQNTQEKIEQALEIAEKGRNSAFISL